MLLVGPGVGWARFPGRPGGIFSSQFGWAGLDAVFNIFNGHRPGMTVFFQYGWGGPKVYPFSTCQAGWANLRWCKYQSHFGHSIATYTNTRP